MHRRIIGGPAPCSGCIHFVCCCVFCLAIIPLLLETVPQFPQETPTPSSSPLQSPGSHQWPAHACLPGASLWHLTPWLQVRCSRSSQRDVLQMQTRAHDPLKILTSLCISGFNQPQTENILEKQFATVLMCTDLFPVTKQYRITTLL